LQAVGGNAETANRAVYAHWLSPHAYNTSARHDLFISQTQKLCSNLQTAFPITSVHRDDLEGLGYDTSNVDDGTMQELASKMADAYLDSVFWIDLPIIADHLEIPKKS
jgi:hypothetical protein